MITPKATLRIVLTLSLLLATIAVSATPAHG